jgi:hypothetical protein
MDKKFWVYNKKIIEKFGSSLYGIKLRKNVGFKLLEI